MNQKNRLQYTLMLTDQGYQNLKKAIFACTLTNLAMFIPAGVSVMIFGELLKFYSEDVVDWMRIGVYFIVGLIGAGIVFLCSKNDYKKTYVSSYMESENTRIAMAEHIRKLPMSVFNSKNLSELTTNLMGDITTSEHVLSHLYPQIIANFIALIIVFFMFIFYDWRMALAVFISVPVGFCLMFGTKALQEKWGQKHVAAKLEASDQVQEYIEGIKVIKACNMDGEQFKMLEKALSTMRSLAIKNEVVGGVLVTGTHMVVQSGVGITVFTGITLLLGGEIELIPMLLCLVIVTRIYGPILTELTLIPEMFYHQLSIRRMRKLMDILPMEGDEEKQIDHYDIEFENVDFSYNEGDETIKNVNITIPAGKITALVGPSGSGKSTLSRLIARFWDVNEGAVTIGGVNVKDLEPEHLMEYMSFVFQDVVLFNDTVYNNIKIGNIHATREEVLLAAKAARCDEFIDKLPNGYETVLGENANTLSGGERQRLSIARALLKNAPIVLLDEATASLDPESESYIQEAISHLIKDKTVIVIAHRLRTIAKADKIIVLNKGEVVEEGTHEELMKTNGLYHRLYHIQQESLGWSV